MKLILFFLMMILFQLPTARVGAKEVCATCGELVGLPNTQAVEAMGKTLSAKLTNESIPPIELWGRQYCARFKVMDANDVGTTMRELDAGPYPTDDYFKIPICQPCHYSNAVKMPLIQYVAEDGDKREGVLNIIWRYYSIKRKDPALFTAVLNAQNTQGETLLDYIETLVSMGKIYGEMKDGSIARIIALACEHGAVYKTHKNKKCNN